MKLKSLIQASVLLVGGWLAGERGLAQLSPTDRIYTLIKGSELLEDCPICDRVIIPVPLTGTFALHFADQNPLFTRYGLQNISFHAGAAPGREYQVLGSGTYQIGGEVAVAQDTFLEVEIDNGFAKTRALCVNGDRTVTKPWPEIQVTVDQTNGTPGQVYHLTLVAVPALQFISIAPDHKSGDVRLGWDANGTLAQLERATNVSGPYVPLSPITTDTSFTDVGALTNRSQTFYRLRQH